MFHLVPVVTLAYWVFKKQNKTKKLQLPALK